MTRLSVETGLAGTMETVDVAFTVPPPCDSPFVCTYARHSAVMRGRLIVKP